MNNQPGNIDKTKINTCSNDDMDALIANLKTEDSRNLNLMRNMKWIYFVLLFVYILLMVVNPDFDLIHRISGICYVIAFALFALIFRKYHREYSEIDYSLPIFDMLTKAAKRYKMTVKNILIAMPSVILIDIGLTLSDIHASTENQLERIVLIQIFYFSAMGISGFIGYLIWRKRQKPLYDGAIQMLKDLEN